MSTKLNCVSIPVSCFLGRKGPAFSNAHYFILKFNCLRELFIVNPCHTVIHGDFQLFALASIVL